MRLLVFVTALLAFTGISQAHAEIKIGIVNVEKVYTDSKAAKSIKSQQEKLTKDLEEELKKQGKVFEKKEKEFQEQRADLSPDELKEKAEKLQKEFNETRADLQKKRSKLQKSLIKAEEKLRQEVIKISGNIAEEKGYDIVMPSQNTIVVNVEMDITDAVLEQLNKKVKEIPVK